jgi:hypothetical protein
MLSEKLLTALTALSAWHESDKFAPQVKHLSDTLIAVETALQEGRTYAALDLLIGAGNIEPPAFTVVDMAEAERKADIAAQVRANSDALASMVNESGLRPTEIQTFAPDEDAAKIVSLEPVVTVEVTDEVDEVDDPDGEIEAGHLGMIEDETPTPKFTSAAKPSSGKGRK